MAPRCQLLSGSLPSASRAVYSPRSALRTFTTSRPFYRPRGGDLGSHLPKHILPEGVVIPEYPHGDATLFKQSNKGLYGGQRIQFGNNVSPDTETKTRRHWKPNVLNKALYSIALKKRIKLRMTSKVLKTIDREGGLDEYLLKESDTRIKELGPMGWALRWRLMQTPEVIARLRAKAAAIGLAEDIIDKHWPREPVYREQLRQARAQQEESQRAKEEQLAEKLRERKVSQDIRARKLGLITTFSTEFVDRRLAPNKRVAEQMALEETTKVKELVKVFGDQYTALAYMRDLRSGKVKAAGGRRAWLARIRADRMFRNYQSERASQGLEDEHAFAAEEEEKDAWGTLVKANNTEPKA